MFWQRMQTNATFQENVTSDVLMVYDSHRAFRVTHTSIKRNRTTVLHPIMLKYFQQ